MTDNQIDLLIAIRNKITDICIDDDIWGDTREIDALLRDVPSGQRNDVDLLLGRTCAVLPPPVDYGLRADDIADMEARTAETAHDEAKDDATGRPW